jgi:hypothetical protein
MGLATIVGDSGKLVMPCAFVDGNPVFPMTSETFAKVAAALALAQSKFERAIRDSENPFFKSRYADLSAVLDACLPHLNSSKICVVQSTVYAGKELFLVTRLLHESGEWIQGAFPLSTLEAVRAMAMQQAEPKPEAGGGLSGAAEGGSKKRGLGVQVIGGEMTYLRRYALAALVCVASDDDDGNTAAGHATGPGPGSNKPPQSAPKTGGLGAR